MEGREVRSRRDIAQLNRVAKARVDEIHAATQPRQQFAPRRRLARGNRRLDLQLLVVQPDHPGQQHQQLLFKPTLVVGTGVDGTPDLAEYRTDNAIVFVEPFVEFDRSVRHRRGVVEQLGRSTAQRMRHLFK